MFSPVLLVVLLAQASPAPIAGKPEPTAPPVIIDVHSKSSICTALEHSIGPSVAGLMQNDYTIMHGLSVLGLVDAGDKTLHFGMNHFDINNLKLENDVSSIVRNLGAVDHLLQPTSADPNSISAEKIETMKKALRDVAHAQSMTLNLLDGALETRQLGEMMNFSDIPNFALSDGETGPASMHQAFNNPGAPTPPPARPVSPDDFFPILRKTEANANQVIVATAGDCTPVNHPLSVDHP